MHQFEGMSVRIVMIDGEPWFVGKDVAERLGYTNPAKAMGDHCRGVTKRYPIVDALGRQQDARILSEPDVLRLIIGSKLPAAERFERWVFEEVLPAIRKTGAYGKPQLHAFAKRVHDNADRIDEGFFSVIGELYGRVHGRFEMMGHILAEKAPDGTELRTDISIGRRFPAWLETYHPQLAPLFKPYKHLLPNGKVVDARQYDNDVWPAFIKYVNTVWMPNHAEEYLRKRDPEALKVLPKVLAAKKAVRPPSIRSPRP